MNNRIKLERPLVMDRNISPRIRVLVDRYGMTMDAREISEETGVPIYKLSKLAQKKTLPFSVHTKSRGEGRGVIITADTFVIGQYLANRNREDNQSGLFDE